MKVFLQKYGEDYVIRLQNQNEDKEITPDLEKFDLEMTTLTGAKSLEQSEKDRLYWQDKRIERDPKVLKPLEIRTFKLNGLKAQKLLEL